MNVIEEIAKQKLVEKIVYQINRNENQEDLFDLIQDVYLILLTKPPEIIQGMYKRKELNFYIANIVYTQVRSSSSPYHRTYRLPRLKTKELNENMV